MRQSAYEANIVIYVCIICETTQMWYKYYQEHVWYLQHMYTSDYAHLLHIYYIYNTTAHIYVPYLHYCGLCIVHMIWIWCKYKVNMNYTPNYKQVKYVLSCHAYSYKDTFYRQIYSNNCVSVPMPLYITNFLSFIFF